MLSNQFYTWIIRIDNLEEVGESLGAMGPNHENVIQVSFINEGFEGDFVKNSAFPLCHEDVGIGGCKFLAHSSTANFEVEFIVKYEVVTGEGYFD